MSETNGHVVITEERSIDVSAPAGKFKLFLRKPADRPDKENKLLYVSIHGSLFGVEQQLASTNVLVDEVNGIQLMPAGKTDEKTGKWMTYPSYPKAFLGGDTRKAIEKAIARNLGMHITFSNPMNGTPEAGSIEPPNMPMPDFEDSYDLDADNGEEE